MISCGYDIMLLSSLLFEFFWDIEWLGTSCLSNRSSDPCAEILFMYFVNPDVLKQVWNLSDQDGDSMLSVREFCTALYLMERFREGRPLPPRLPPGIHLDDPRGPDGQMSAGQRQGYGGSNWQQQGN